METIVRPRLNDFHGILLPQDSVDYAIPFLEEVRYCHQLQKDSCRAGL